MAAMMPSVESPGKRGRRVFLQLQRASSAAAEERRDEGTGKRRLPAVGCNEGLGVGIGPPLAA
jgi:hypothetical protein